VGQRSVTQGHWNWCHSIRLNFYSRPNYGAILYRLRNIATYWYKIAKSLYPSCILCPCREWPHRNFVKMFDAGKTRMIGRPYGEKKTVTIRYAVFIWYRSVTGRQTDRRTYLLYQYRASVCWRAIKTYQPNGCEHRESSRLFVAK